MPLYTDRQLFTIGLVQLNDDFTPVLDAYGVPRPTYGNEDIMTFARLWTGGERQPARTNIENIDGTANGGRIQQTAVACSSSTVSTMLV